ncbi:MAG: hypothetical protein PVI87_09550 [Gammaproteobacteria bacterium]
MELVQLDAWLASLHPYLRDVSSLQLITVAVISWLGCRAICGRSDDDDDEPPPRRTAAEVRQILDAARRRRR